MSSTELWELPLGSGSWAWGGPGVSTVMVERRGRVRRQGWEGRRGGGVRIWGDQPQRVLEVRGQGESCLL